MAIAKRKGAKKEAPKKEAPKKAAAKKEAPKKAAKKEEAPALTEDYLAGIIDLMDELRPDLEKSIKTAAAARRARKLTTELAKIFKEFRKHSIEHHKK